MRAFTERGNALARATVISRIDLYCGSRPSAFQIGVAGGAVGTSISARAASGSLPKTVTLAE
jgi:hypothetical protein